LIGWVNIYANALALMHDGVDSPRQRYACHPSLLRKEGKNKIIFNLRPLVLAQTFAIYLPLGDKSFRNFYLFLIDLSKSG